MPVLSGDAAASIEHAAAALAAGELVAFPTETVYGLGARADDDAAARRIFEAKGRPADHPLIVHVVDAAAAAAFAADWPVSAQRLSARYWPGPLSIVVHRRTGVAHAAAGGLPTVALRCPDHPVAQALLGAARVLGVAGVAAPSANRFGRVSPTRAAHVVDEFGPALPVLDGGECREGIESSIVDCTVEPPVLLRPGTLVRADIEAVLGTPLGRPGMASPRVSGSLESHYAPTAPVSLVAAADLAPGVAAAARAVAPGTLGVYSRQPAGAALPNVRHHPMPDNPAAVAHELFAVLRRFDVEGVAQIWVERPPETSEWEGVRDRLQRASAR